MQFAHHCKMLEGGSDDKKNLFCLAKTEAKFEVTGFLDDNHNNLKSYLNNFTQKLYFFTENVLTKTFSLLMSWI